MGKQKMSHSELKLMQIIWEKDMAVSASELLLTLQSEKNWKYTTVSTFLTRMKEKGFLNSRKEGNSNVYSAAISKETYKAQETQEFLESIHGGSAKSLIASLYGDQLTEDELDELIHWIGGKEQ